MSSPLSYAIVELTSAKFSVRAAAAWEIYRAGRSLADGAVSQWWTDAELSTLLFAPNPAVTVGLAVGREIFAKIREANESPKLASVPPDQDAEEFELHFPEGVSLDILTTRTPGGNGAIARYLEKFKEGIQQVEFQCSNVDRSTAILSEKFSVAAIYPQTRAGADGTRVNFFLVSSVADSKVLVELCEPPKTSR
ncbi:MAG TPA: hypothetical protein VLK33_07180 [Terriglobales bacterium]|nr:hypothetical protein [Terriglobales bacterium]